MKRGAITGSILLLKLVALWSVSPTDARDAGPPATIAALQTRVAALSTRVAQLTTPAPATVGGAAATGTRPVHGIDAVELQVPGTLTIRQGTTETLVVTAEVAVLAMITTEVRDGRLTIGARGSFSATQPIRYALTITTLRAIANTGSGRIDVAPLRVPRLDLTADGSGNLSLTGLAVTDLRVALSGSGSCTVAGTTDRQDVVLSGSGGYHAERLASREAGITVSGSGGATVQVSDRLDARVQGSGDVAYVGAPQITQTVSGSGRLRKLG